MSMQKSYPSNISQEQFEKIRPILESASRKQNQENLICMTYFVGCCTS
ncbi:putative transposase [Wolbachia endosymbiont of Cimex lectularius]|nr:putative transposase [Wolbachia endosymbiont of Cimex lectularius]BAO99435.1 putative transposase [Wolbachia endosymbiont of Cimex lectularius]BAO99454.1 putative transposase [Wolbachia endosymbiont of Cimex lectularius]